MAWNDLASNECPTKADIEGVFARFVSGMIIAFKVVLYQVDGHYVMGQMVHLT